MTQQLKFENDKGAGLSKWIAAGLVLALVGWFVYNMAGVLLGLKSPEPVVEDAPRAEAAPVTVAIAVSNARAVTEEFLAEGQAVADREGTIRSEAPGTVAEVLVSKGDMVDAGAVIARIDPAQRQADLERTQATLNQAERDYRNVSALLQRGVATNDRLLQAESALAAARAGLANAREAMNNLDITAPFAGRIEALSIEAGEVIGAGAEAGRVVDLDPLTVTVQVPQQAIAALHTGQQAQVRFITGREGQGAVSFVGSSADTQTRTFEAEVEVPNPDLSIPAGLSARVRIPTGETEAHFLTPAILSLDTDGTLGVKAVGDDNTVLFYPVTIVRAQTDGLWVTGLPDQLRLITVGQGFVSRGETVIPKEAELLDIAKGLEEKPQ